MPTEARKTYGSLYYQSEDGQRQLVCPHDVTLKIGETNLEGFINEISSDSMECSFITYVSNDLGRVLFQKVMMMPNNWLKTHGYPMRRGKRRNEPHI